MMRTTGCVTTRRSPSDVSEENDNKDRLRRRPIPDVPARTLTIGAWYRHLLTVGRDEAGRLKDTDLDVRVFRMSRLSFWRWAGTVRVSQQHPVSTNRIAMNLALLSLGLGIISLIIPFI